MNCDCPRGECTCPDLSDLEPPARKHTRSRRARTELRFFRVRGVPPLRDLLPVWHAPDEYLVFFDGEYVRCVWCASSGDCVCYGDHQQRRKR